MRDEVWDYLTNFESSEQVRRHYERLHGRPTSDLTHSREIAACFSHARSYFEAASLASKDIRPLLLYYGVVCMARGASLFLNKGLRETHLKPAHGLTVGDWRTEFNKPAPDFGELSIKLNAGGTFQQLASATANASNLKNNSSGVNFRFVNDAPETGSTYTFSNLLARIPALMKHYFLWRQTIGFMGCELSVDATHTELKLAIGGNPVAALHGANILAGTAFAAIPPNGVVRVPTPPSNASCGFSDDIGMMGIGRICMLKRYPAASNLSQVCALFALSFIMGNLVRYYPRQWDSLLKGQISDEALPTLLAAVDHVQESFPRKILEFLPTVSA